MMRWTTGALLLSLATMACGGRYDVGAMDDHGAGGASNAAGSTMSGAVTAGNGTDVGTAGEPTMAGLGGTSSVGPGMPSDALGPSCVAPGSPPALTGPFLEPKVVWDRIRTLTGSQLPTPPSGFPATTTYAWAGDMVQVALADAKNTKAPGAAIAFLQQWLELKVDASPEGLFQQPWAQGLFSNQSVLQVLLKTPYLAPKQPPAQPRTGIFTEPAWLAEHAFISSRGAAMQRALFGVEVPPPPAGLPGFTPDPNLSDRQALEQQILGPTCAGCHDVVDPPGHARGNYAADGSYRELDHGLPIDSASTLRLWNSDVSVAFDGILDFGAKFADSCAASTGIADAFLRTAITMNTGTFNDELFQGSRLRVQQAFVNEGRSFAAFVKAYIQSPAGLYP